MLKQKICFFIELSIAKLLPNSRRRNQLLSDKDKKSISLLISRLDSNAIRN